MNKFFSVLAPLLTVFAMSVFSGCSAEDIASAARFDCKTSITLDKDEKNACLVGVDLTTQAAKEAGLTRWSSNQAYKAAARRAEKLCDQKYNDDSKLQNGCYMGIQACRDVIESK